ncbi:MAG: class I SAM-dependent methyltransferase [Candidatus Omnitrophota bacterium]
MSETCLEKVVCSNCGADDYSVVYPAKYQRRDTDDAVSTFRSSGDEILIDQLVKCKACGLQYLNPRLRAGLILTAYSSGSDEIFVSQSEARERTFDQQLKRIERIAKKGRVLDVGTAGGSFLAAARKRGWEVEGCEPNRWLCEWAKQNYGLSITPGTIFDLNQKNESFDVITLWDVLEHTLDPKSVLTECRRLLKPNGILVINYPDIGSWIARFMGRRWVFLLSVHLFYFTFETLQKMLRQTGFTVIQRKKHWQGLELDYILERMKAYVPILPGCLQRAVRALRVGKLIIPYWMGQTLVIARRDE